MKIENDQVEFESKEEMDAKVKPIKELANNPILRYGAIKHEIRLLENELNFLKDEVTKQVIDLAGDDRKPIDIPYGTFILAKSKSWKFSPVVDELVKTLEERKAHEKATGDATFEETVQLRFNVKE